MQAVILYFHTNYMRYNVQATACTSIMCIQSDQIVNLNVRNSGVFQGRGPIAYSSSRETSNSGGGGGGEGVRICFVYLR